MKSGNSRILWWLAFGAEVIAATLETIEGDYIKAVGLWCLALAFLFLAVKPEAEQSPWQKGLAILLVLISLGLLAYSLLVKR